MMREATRVYRKRRTLYTIAIALSLLILALYLAVRSVLLRSYLREEEADARLKANVVLDIIGRETDRLTITAKDWGYWDDTYRFVQGRNRGFPAANIEVGTLDHLRLDLMAFFTLDGRLVYSAASDAWPATTAPKSDAWVGAAAAAGAALAAEPDAASVAGVILTAKGPMLAAVHVIRDSAEALPPDGWLVLGRFLESADLMRQLRAVVAHGPDDVATVDVRALAEEELPEEFRSAAEEADRTREVVVRVGDRNAVYAYGILRDLRGAPAAVLRLGLPRTFYALGVEALWLHTAATIILVLLFALVGVWAAGRTALLSANHLDRDARRFSWTALMELSQRQQVLLIAAAFCVFAILAFGFELVKDLMLASASPWMASALTVLYVALLSAAGVGVALLLYQQMRDRAERALRTSGDTYRAIFESAGAATVIVNENDTILFANSEAEQLTGYSRAELESRKKWMEFIAPEHRPRLEAYGQRWNTGEDPADVVECRVRGRTGVTRDVLARVRRIPGTGNVVVSIVDTTEQKRMEGELREKEAFLRSIFTSIQDGLCVLAPDFTIQTANPTLEAWLSSSAPVVGRRCYDVLCGRGRVCEDCPAGRSFREGRAASETIPREGKNGEISGWLDVFTFPRVDAVTGETTAVILYVRDVTGRVRSEENLRAANELLEEANRRLKETTERAGRMAARAEAASVAKSEFLANLTHEMRTPLNGLLGMLDVALEAELSEEQSDLLRAARQSGDSLLNVINGLLEYAAVEKGGLLIESWPFLPRDELPSTLRTLAGKAAEKGLELAYIIRPAVPEVLVGDYFRIQQIVLHLVGNAIRYTERGEVSVEVEVDPGSKGVGPGEEVEVLFVVRDTGVGMSAAEQERLFSPFAFAGRAGGGASGGAGLGLGISRRLVELMGGRMWVHSKEGEGSSFHFSLPLRRGGERDLPEAPEVSLSGVRILVADNHHMNRECLSAMLAGWDAAVTVTADGADALRALREAAEAHTTFDLALLDGDMPRLDGVAVAENVVGNRSLCGACVLLLTPLELAKQGARAESLGVAFLTKPVVPAELMVTVLRLVGSGLDRSILLRPDDTDNAGPLRILLAEDDPTCRDALTAVLRRRGYAVYPARNGEEALRIIQQVPVDLALMDDKMPGMDGRTATRRIRDEEKTTPRHLWIIGMTADDSRVARRKCLDAGMDDYVNKPVVPFDLEAAIRRASLDRAAGRGKRPAGAAACPLDIASALEVLGGDLELLKELVDDFLEDEDLMPALDKAVRTRDGKGTVHLAHRLRGALGNIGALRAARLAAEIEALGRAIHFEDALAELQKLDSEMAALRHFVSDPQWIEAMTGTRHTETTGTSREQGGSTP